MKIIGEDGNRGYIAVVSHMELEKLFDKYHGKLNNLTIGSEVNLGLGYDFAASIKSACSSMVDATKSFERNQSAILGFAAMVADKKIEVSHE